MLFDNDDGDASIASGLSFVLLIDVDVDDDVDFVTTAICCAGLKTTKYKYKFYNFLEVKKYFFVSHFV